MASAFLPSVARPGEGEMVHVYKTKRAEANKKMLEPYADILKAAILCWKRCSKEQLLATLRAAPVDKMEIPLFSWNSVSYLESLDEMKARLAAMSPEDREKARSEHAMNSRLIRIHGWETYMSVEQVPTTTWSGEDDEYVETVLGSQKVNQIFRSTDLGWRLAAAFGPTFSPEIRWEKLREMEGEGGFIVYKKTLVLRYWPFGLGEMRLNNLLKAYRAEKERETAGEIRVLGYWERIQGLDTD